MPNHEYYLNLALNVARGSKCNKKKVGSVIVNRKGRIVSTGFNGAPKGVCNDCEKDGKTLPTTLHSELNAIIFAKQDLTDCILYVTLGCCLHCAALVIQSGITEVHYIEEYDRSGGVEFLINHGVTCKEWSHLKQSE